jgi:NADPH:quinone reductase
MYALVLNSFAGPEGVTLTQTEEPQPANGEVVVAIEAAGVGQWDYASTEGLFTNMGGLATFPQTLGWDFAGTIAAVAPDVADWQIGDRVFGFSAQPWTTKGVFAERAALPANLMAAIPDGLTSVEAAALPVSLLTAELAVQTAGVSTDQSVLVIGAAGVVGGLVVQLAKARGANVIASVSAADSAVALELGSTHAVDRSGDVAAQVQAFYPEGVDVIIDFAGPAGWESAITALRDGGSFVTAVPGGLPTEDRGITAEQIGVSPNPSQLQELAARVVTGKVRQRIATVLPLSEGVKALDIVGKGGVSGKVVLNVTA